MLVAPPEYPGRLYRGRYAYEHHIVWWQETGELVGEGCVIHHRNGDKHDNRFANLEHKTSSQHSADHAVRRIPVVLACSWCGERFERDRRNYNFKVKQGQTQFFCCRSHQVKAQHASLGRKRS